MFQVYDGPWRGPVSPEDPNPGYIKISFSFRRYMRCFDWKELMVFLCLALYMDKDGECFPSYRELQQATGMSLSTIQHAVERLCVKTIEGRRVLSRCYERDENGRAVGSAHYTIFPTGNAASEKAGRYGSVRRGAKNPKVEKPSSDFPEA